MFKNKPDVFDLIIPKSSINKLLTKQINSPFGESIEEYCYFNDTLIGELIRDTKEFKTYYQKFKIHFKEYVQIRLTPALSRNRYLDVPEYELFNLALKTNLKKLNSFFLICEIDCESSKVEESSTSEDSLDDLKKFCLGISPNCPSFILRDKN